MSSLSRNKTYTQSDVDYIASVLPKAKRYRNGFIACCPTHDDQNPSFGFWLGEDGRFASKCYAGREYKDTIKAIEDILSSSNSSFITTSLPSFSSGHKHGLSKRQREIFEEEARVIQCSDVAYKYLTETRKIPLDSIPKDLRYHPGLDYWQVENDKPVSVGKFNAMLAGIRDAAGELIGFQRYYLTSSGRKLKDERPDLLNRKLTGSMTGGAIKLYKPSEVLLIAEGVETALAASFIFKLPCWAVVSSSNLPNVQIPSEVKVVHICIDSDKAGYKYSRELAIRLLDERKSVFYREVPKNYQANDWADVLELIER